MGYVNGPQMLRDIANLCIKHGVPVDYSSGWDVRGNGQNWPVGGPKGFTNHHTAGGNNYTLDRNLIDGVPGLSGPLCNFAITYGGRIVLVAAYPANHAGASGGWDTAPLPRTNLFNREVLGVEIQYRGIEPMAPAQYRAMCVLNRAAQVVLGWREDMLTSKNHQGTSIQGKWDPGYANGKTYNIAQQRKDMIAAFGEDEGPIWDAIMAQFLGSKE